MIKTISLIAAVSAVSATAQGQFELNSVNFGVLTGTTSITATGDFVLPGTIPGDLGTPGIEFDGSELDSGLWLSGTGIDTIVDPQTGNTFTSGNLPETFGPPDIIVGDRLRGFWGRLIDPNEPAGSNGLGGAGSVLVARLSVPEGDRIRWSQATGRASIRLEPGGSFVDIFSTVNASAIEVDGRYFKFVSVDLGPGRVRGIDVDTYDLYFNEVPTPGTLALPLLGGSLFCRRRR